MVKSDLPVRWDEEALKDLKIIYKYIKRQSPEGAEKVKNEIIRLAGMLNKNPEKFPKEALMGKEGNFRFIPKWSYKIIYEITSNEVIIAMIFHASQSPAKLKKKK
jgi:addiction module RelE/StbE family toxin